MKLSSLDKFVNLNQFLLDKGTVCEVDPDCPRHLACMYGKCLDPCKVDNPCHETSICSVITTKRRTLLCECKEGWMPVKGGNSIVDGCVKGRM